ncbi:GNAT family N-acetyltransferase [Cytobacillus sp. FJAT-54145]|uniref:GNAT family N-acetyltransferase n=1 Tax=Cytobacillus spartinae TaxID=3299023 RepID=A0ABW6KBB5_9BACI
MQKESYKVEAEYIGTYEIPPLKESLQELMDCGETFIGYYEGGEIVGALSYKLEDNEIDIHRVMVDPNHFRKGIARKLIGHVEEHIPSQGMVVCTGAKNTPAVTLYLKLGFEKVRDIEVGHGLVLTQFRK